MLDINEKLAEIAADKPSLKIELAPGFEVNAVEFSTTESLAVQKECKPFTDKEDFTSTYAITLVRACKELTDDNLDAIKQLPRLTLEDAYLMVLSLNGINTEGDSEKKN